MQILHYLLHCVYGVGVAHENFSPVLDFKERFQQLRWIGHGCDSDAQLATLYEYWLVNHSSELFDPATSRSAFIPPPRMHVYLDLVIVISLFKIFGVFFTTSYAFKWIDTVGLDRIVLKMSLNYNHPVSSTRDSLLFLLSSAQKCSCVTYCFWRGMHIFVSEFII